MAVTTSVANLLAAPQGARDRQLVFGEPLTRLGVSEGMAYVRAERDGYHGFVSPEDLAPAVETTHRITVRASHAYASPDFKTPEQIALSFGARLAVLSETEAFAETNAGFVPLRHISRMDHMETDPARVAELFLHTPYLWGGNSSSGIDCSGLVQAAVLACGVPCPGDSDQQMQHVGHAVEPGARFERNDLLFWKGHVALVAGPSQIIHANAHHMAVAFEPIAPALNRIEEQGGGPLLAHKRL